MSVNVFINDEGIQEIVVEGDLTADGFTTLKQQALAADEEQRNKGLAVLTLVNIEKMGHLDMSIVLDIIKLLGEMSYDKTAFYGDYKTDSTVLARLIKDVSSFGSRRVSSFKTRDEALTWLRS